MRNGDVGLLFDDYRCKLETPPNCAYYFQEFIGSVMFTYYLAFQLKVLSEPYYLESITSC